MQEFTICSSNDDDSSEDEEKITNIKNVHIVDPYQPQSLENVNLESKMNELESKFEQWKNDMVHKLTSLSDKIDTSCDHMLDVSLNEVQRTSDDIKGLAKKYVILSKTIEGIDVKLVKLSEKLKETEGSQSLVSDLFDQIHEIRSSIGQTNKFWK